MVQSISGKDVKIPADLYIDPRVTEWVHKEVCTAIIPGTVKGITIL
jgi:hypothetical protein